MCFYFFGLFFIEVPLPDEVESYLVLQECLEMRKRYVFREDVAPWEKDIISDPSTPKPNPDPFQYTSEGKSDVSLSLLATDSSISACYKFASIDLCYHSPRFYSIVPLIHFTLSLFSASF